MEVNINLETFQNDKSMMKYLYINKPKFPKIWSSEWTIQLIPESNIKYMQGYELSDKYPDHFVLNYPINNLKIRQ